MHTTSFLSWSCRMWRRKFVGIWILRVSQLHHSTGGRSLALPSSPSASSGRAPPVVAASLEGVKDVLARLCQTLALPWLLRCHHTTATGTAPSVTPRPQMRWSALPGVTTSIGLPKMVLAALTAVRLTSPRSATLFAACARAMGSPSPSLITSATRLHTSVTVQPCSSEPVMALRLR
eukprot:3932197-Rhodomonas_salina.3